MHTLRVVLLLGICFIAGSIAADMTALIGQDRCPAPVWNTAGSGDIAKPLKSAQSDSIDHDSATTGETRARES